VLAAAGCTLVASIIVLAVVLNMEHNPQVSSTQQQGTYQQHQHQQQH
jgi:hypothetical protein